MKESTNKKTNKTTPPAGWAFLGYMAAAQSACDATLAKPPTHQKNNTKNDLTTKS